jgi:hypothetical protein
MSLPYESGLRGMEEVSSAPGVPDMSPAGAVASREAALTKTALEWPLVYLGRSDPLNTPTELTSLPSGSPLCPQVHHKNHIE